MGAWISKHWKGGPSHAVDVRAGDVIDAIETGNLYKLRRLAQIVDVSQLVVKATGKTVLHVAAAAGERECLRFLLESVVDGNAVNVAANHSKDTALHCAISYGGPGADDIVRTLLLAKADINALNLWLRTPVLQSVVENRDALAAILIQSGANTDLGDEAGMVPIHVCANHNKTDLLARLLDAGADIDCYDHRGRTALYFAVLSRHNDILDSLVERGCNLNLCNDFIFPLKIEKPLPGYTRTGRAPLMGTSPLQLGIAKCNLPAVRALLHAGARTNVTGQEVNTCSKTLQLLVDKPTSIDDDYDNDNKICDCAVITDLVLQAHGRRIPDALMRELMKSVERSGEGGPQARLTARLRVLLDMFNPQPGPVERARDSPLRTVSVATLQDLSRIQARVAMMTSGKNIVWACEHLDILPHLKRLLMLVD
jgi:ankyrin repeat protein